MTDIQLFFFAMGIAFVALFLTDLFLLLLGIFLARKSAKKQKERYGYVKHIYDRR